MQQPAAIMQASEDLIEKGSKPAARLGRRIKSSGTLSTVHFVFIFQSASVAPWCRSVCMTEIQSEKHECICHTGCCISHTVSVTSEARELFAAQKAGRATFTAARGDDARWLQ